MSKDNRGKGFTSKFSVYCLGGLWVVSGVRTRVNFGSQVLFDLLDEFDPITFQFTPNEAG